MCFVPTLNNNQCSRHESLNAVRWESIRLPALFSIIIIIIIINRCSGLLLLYRIEQQRSNNNKTNKTAAFVLTWWIFNVMYCTVPAKRHRTDATDKPQQYNDPYGPFEAAHRVQMQWIAYGEKSFGGKCHNRQDGHIRWTSHQQEIAEK